MAPKTCVCSWSVTPWWPTRQHKYLRETRAGRRDYSGRQPTSKQKVATGSRHQQHRAANLLPLRISITSSNDRRPANANHFYPPRPSSVTVPVTCRPPLQQSCCLPIIQLQSRTSLPLHRPPARPLQAVASTAPRREKKRKWNV